MNQNEQKQTLKITWLIKTFHQAGLDFLEIQSTEKWSAEKSKDVLSQISVPAAPTWMIKKRPQSVDQDLRIAAFDPALRIETTLEMIKNSEMSLNNDELFYSSPLSSEDLHQKLKMTHTPYLHTCVLESEFCNEQKNNDSFLLQSYFKLSPWKKLKFLELYWGLTKSHTTLEFQPIDFSSPNT